MQPIIAPLPKALLSQEIASLNTKDRYIERGKFEVYITQAHKIPTILKEIGRLRETTFREVGEGTGNAIDIDCLLYTSPSPRDATLSRMPSSA